MNQQNPNWSAEAGQTAHVGALTLHIFVNRRKFGESDGVKAIMTRAEVAALVGVPASVAVVRRGNDAGAPIIATDDPFEIHQAEHFLVTREVVEGGFEIPPRVLRELELLASGGQRAECTPGADRAFVIYRSVPTAGGTLGLPTESDVIVPVPSGYPASMIDLAGLPADSPLLPRVRGGQNNQGVVDVAGVRWRLASYHPHNNGGGPPWDQTRHGFHTYFDQVLAWLAKLS